MMKNKHLYAIDFGTCNSYFCRCAVDEAQPESIQLVEGEDGLATVLLHRGDREPLIGNTAIEEWGEATESERTGYDFRFNFKPDIVTNERARRDAVLFLKTFILQAQRASIAFAPDRAEVLIGVPSEAASSFSERLAAIAGEAGYGSPTLIDEPKGALLHHLWRGDITAGDASRGTLVVDFGGGTCDFAYMTRLEVRHSWGDMLLGGRLYDDLFFQWFLELNPTAEAGMRRTGDTFYYLWHACRELKEKFSRAMMQDRSVLFTRVVGRGNYGGVSNIGWDEFVARATAYTPSATLARYLGEQCESDAWRDRFAAGPMDLLDWFRRTLADGLEGNNIRSSDIERVILTGGSSLWPMVKDTLCEVLHLDQERIIRSNRPFASIAEGLAVLRPLQRRTSESRNSLLGEQARFLDEMTKMIDGEFVKVVDVVIKSLLTLLFDNKVVPLLRRFKSEGGTIRHLEERIAVMMRAAEPEMQSILTRDLGDLAAHLPTMLEKRMAAWFKSHGTTYLPDPGTIGIDTPHNFGTHGLEREFSSFFDDIQHTLAVGLVGAIVASVCGGGGLALIASGLPGIIAGLVLVVVSGYFLARHGRKLSLDMAKDQNLPPGLLKVILPDMVMSRQLKRGREEFRKQILEAIKEGQAGSRSDLTKRISANIKHEIDSLSELNQL
ncbi:MAG: hypothetical protein GY835_26035 [bacterium]|nr:hypothetical protein [bacterium]